MQKDSFGALWPSTAKTDFKGLLQNSELFPHTAPTGKILITSMIGGEFGQKASIDELLELCKKSLAPFSIKPLRALSVTRWPHAIPQYDDLHAAFIEELENVIRITPGFHFLGAEVGGVGIADRVAMAKQVSERILGT
jgi:protoporphyrinogen oxidase